MSPNPAGRSGAGSSSMHLGKAEPRARRNAQSGVSDEDCDNQTIELQNGKLRVRAFDGVPQLSEKATLAEVIARLNVLTRKGAGG